MDKRPTINDVMMTVPMSSKWRWCTASVCGCMGCCNGKVTSNGYSREDWEQWLINNPKPSDMDKPTTEWYSFK